MAVKSSMLLVILGGIFTVNLLTVTQCAKQPHILFILADDYGWNDIGKTFQLLFSNLNIYKQTISVWKFFCSSTKH